MDFSRKARMVANRVKTEAPLILTYSSVVSRDSVRLTLAIAELNDLDIMSCVIVKCTLSREYLVCSRSRAWIGENS